MTYIVNLKREAQRVAKLAGVALPPAFNVKHDGLGDATDVVLRRLSEQESLNSPGEFLIAHARLDIGVKEQPAGSNSGPRIDKALRLCGIPLSWPAQSKPWCAAMVSLWLWEVGWKRFKSPSTRAWESWGSSQRLEVPRTRGRAGDVVTFQFESETPGGEHTGLIISLSGTVYTTIEGNTSPSETGSQSNGGMVCVRKRPVGLINHIYRVL